MQTKYFFSTNWHPTLVTILDTFHIQLSLWRRHSGKGLVLNSSLSKYVEIENARTSLIKSFSDVLYKGFKEPYEISMAEGPPPPRRSNFIFSPPAHLCAVTYIITKISLNVTVNFTPTRIHFRKHNIYPWQPTLIYDNFSGQLSHSIMPLT